MISLLYAGCTKEDPEPEPSEDPVEEPVDDTEGEIISGVSDETKSAFEIYPGELGVNIDPRQLASLGYRPAKISLAVEGALSSYSQTDIPVDECTNIAVYKLAVEDQSPENVEMFGDGVTITVTVFDADVNELENISTSSFIFNSVIKTLKIETEKPKLLEPLTFDPEIPYHFKLAGNTNQFLSAIAPVFEDEVPKTGNIGYDSYKINNADQKFYLKELDDGTFEIRTQSGYILGAEYLPFLGTLYFLYDRESVDLFISFGVGYYGGGAPSINFELEQTGDGLVKIHTKQDTEYMSYKGVYNGYLT